MSWLYLFIAGVFEVGFAAMLRLSEGFTRIWPTIGFLLLGLISVWFLSLSQKPDAQMRSIPLGTAYAVWTGIGAFGTAIVGIAFYRDPITFWRLLFLTLLIVSAMGLVYVTESKTLP
jgi:quaternary ammonium compound-resistance protein SugE